MSVLLADGRSGGPGFSSSLQRGLSILLLFTPEAPVLGVAEIASKLGMTRSTTHRYVSTLQVMGFLTQEEENRKYRLGVGVLRLGMSVLNTMDVRTIAYPFMNELADNVGHTVNLSILDGPDVIYIERIRRSPGVDIDIAVGSRLPAYCTAMGKVLMAFASPDDRSAAIEATEFLARAPGTITTPKSLQEALDKTRKTGVAISNEELLPGLRAIAAPVLGSDGLVRAALSLAVNSSRKEFPSVVKEQAPLVAETARRISGQLGAHI